LGKVSCTPRLLSSGQVVDLLLAHEFAFVSHRGSHVKDRDALGRTVIVPAGRREILRGALGSIIRQSGIDKRAFD
jgi:predicted RNA binding protein YcfA (HicA-like mRNA interferase family)